MHPSICMVAPSGFTTTPISWAHHMRLDPHLPRGLVHRDLGHVGHVGAGVQPARHAETPSAGGRAGLPVGQLRHGLEDAPQPRVGGVPQPELHGVHARVGGHDVDLRLPGERVGVRAGGAPRSRGEGVHVPGRVGDHGRVGHVVEHLRAPGARHVDVVVPELESSRCVDARADLHHRCRVEGVVEELLLAGPHDLDGRLVIQARRAASWTCPPEDFPPKPPPT